MNQEGNSNAEYGEAKENIALQNDRIGSVNSETVSTINTTGMNTIITHDRPAIVVSESQEVVKELGESDVAGSNEEALVEVQTGGIESVEVPQVEQFEQTVIAPEVDTVNEVSTNGTDEGKIEDIEEVIHEPLKLSQDSTTEEQLEYEEVEEDDNAQPQAIGESIGIDLESNSNLINSEKVDNAGKEKVPTNGGVQNTRFPNSNHLTGQDKQENVNTKSEATAQGKNESNINENKGNGYSGTGETAGDDGNGTQNGKPSESEQQPKDNAPEFTEEAKKVEVVMANGEVEEIELDEKVLNPVEESQYSTLKSNPNEHFDEGMDDINTLVENAPNFQEKNDIKIPIYLKHKNTEFLLFPTQDQDRPRPIFEDEKSEDITLDEFFAILRTIPEFNFELNDEIILSIPQFGGITVTEDNVYCKDLQLSDFLDVYYKLCDCTTQKEKVPKQLDFKLTTQPRFIMKYNSLVDTVKEKGGFENISNVDYVDNEIEGSRKKRKL